MSRVNLRRYRSGAWGWDSLDDFHDYDYGIFILNLIKDKYAKMSNVVAFTEEKEHQFKAMFADGSWEKYAVWVIKPVSWEDEH